MCVRTLGLVFCATSLIYTGAFAGVITVADAVQLTINNHPDVLAAHANEESARYAWKSARGSYFPSVDLSISQGRQLYMSSASNSYTSMNRTERRLSVTQLLFDGWGTAGLVHSNAADYFASKSYSKYQENAMAFSAIEAYVDVLRYRNLIALGEQNLSLHAKTLNKVSAMYRGGAGNKADVDLAKGRYSSAETIQTNTKRACNNAQATFLEVVGELPNFLRQPNPPLRSLPRSLAEAILIAHTRHPALAQSMNQYESARYREVAARSALFPKVTFELSSAHNKNLDGVAGHANDEKAMVVMRYNLFKGGTDFAEVGENEEKTQAARYGVDKVQNHIQQTVTQAWNNLHASRERLQQLRARTRQTEEVVVAYRQQFVLGKRYLLNLLDTERELFSAKSDLIMAEFDYIHDVYALYASMGVLIHYVK